jgi:hypothetical protein
VDVRRALDHAEPFAAFRACATSSPGRALDSSDRTYRLALSSNDVLDVDGFARAAMTALDARRKQIAALEAVAARWTGEPLSEDCYGPGRCRARTCHRALRRVLAALASARFAALRPPRHSRCAPPPLRAGLARRGGPACAVGDPRARQPPAWSPPAPVPRLPRALLDELGIEPALETAALQRLNLAGEPV